MHNVADQTWLPKIVSIGSLFQSANYVEVQMLKRNKILSRDKSSSYIQFERNGEIASERSRKNHLTFVIFQLIRMLFGRCNILILSIFSCILVLIIYKHWIDFQLAKSLMFSHQRCLLIYVTAFPTHMLKPILA